MKLRNDETGSKTRQKAPGISSDDRTTRAPEHNKKSMWMPLRSFGQRKGPSFEEGAQVLIIKGDEGQMLQTATVLRVMKIMIDVSYWDTESEKLTTARKHRWSVIGLDSGIVVESDHNGVAWVTHRRGDDSGTTGPEYVTDSDE